MSRPYQFSDSDHISSPLDRQPQPQAQPPSFRQNVNRAKTKKWVEAKSYSYEGDDWGEYDEDDEYGVQEAATHSQAAALQHTATRDMMNPSYQNSQQPPFQVMRKQPSFNVGDERSAFSASAHLAPTHANNFSSVDKQRYGSHTPSPDLPASQASSNAMREDKPLPVVPPTATLNHALEMEDTSPVMPSIIRPADIYRRMLEEREKEQTQTGKSSQSVESRASIDSTPAASAATSGDYETPRPRANRIDSTPPQLPNATFGSDSPFGGDDFWSMGTRSTDATALASNVQRNRSLVSQSPESLVTDIAHTPSITGAGRRPGRWSGIIPSTSVPPATPDQDTHVQRANQTGQRDDTQQPRTHEILKAQDMLQGSVDEPPVLAATSNHPVEHHMTPAAATNPMVNQHATSNNTVPSSTDGALREADIASAIKTAPANDLPALAAAEHDAQDSFLDRQSSTLGEQNMPPSHAESPSKGRVVDSASGLDIDRARQLAVGDQGVLPTPSMQKVVTGNTVSSPSPSTSSANAITAVSGPAADLLKPSTAVSATKDKDSVFRPKLPGGWESYATTASEQSLERSPEQASQLTDDLEEEEPTTPLAIQHAGISSAVPETSAFTPMPSIKEIPPSHSASSSQHYNSSANPASGFIPHQLPMQGGHGSRKTDHSAAALASLSVAGTAMSGAFSRGEPLQNRRHQEGDVVARPVYYRGLDSDSTVMTTVPPTPTPQDNPLENRPSALGNNPVSPSTRDDRSSALGSTSRTFAPDSARSEKVAQYKSPLSTAVAAQSVESTPPVSDFAIKSAERAADPNSTPRVLHGSSTNHEVVDSPLSHPLTSAPTMTAVTHIPQELSIEPLASKAAMAPVTSVPETSTPTTSASVNTETAVLPPQNKRISPLRPPITTNMSTDDSPSDYESDRLRKEIVRSLSPVETSAVGDHHLQDSSVRDSGLATKIRPVSSALPQEYDNYFNDTELHARSDFTGGAETTSQDVASLETTPTVSRAREPHDQSALGTTRHSQITSNVNEDGSHLEQDHTLTTSKLNIPSDPTAQHILPTIVEPYSSSSLPASTGFDHNLPDQSTAVRRDPTDSSSAVGRGLPAQRTSMDRDLPDQGASLSRKYSWEPETPPVHGIVSPISPAKEFESAPSHTSLATTARLSESTGQPAMPAELHDSSTANRGVIDHPRLSGEGLHVINAVPGEIPEGNDTHIPPVPGESMPHSNSSTSALDTTSKKPTANLSELSANTTTASPTAGSTLPYEPKLASFREIMNIKDPEQRISALHQTRQSWATHDTGLSGWLGRTMAAHPEHAQLHNSPAPVSSSIDTTGPFYRNKGSVSRVFTRTSMDEPASPSQHGRTASGISPAAGRTSAVGGGTSKAKETLGSIGGKGLSSAKGLFAKGKLKLKAASAGHQDRD